MRLKHKAGPGLFTLIALLDRLAPELQRELLAGDRLHAPPGPIKRRSRRDSAW